MNEPHRLGQGLERMMRLLGGPPPNTMRSIEARWAEIVGPALAEHSRPVELVDGVLTVRCPDPIWSSQIRWMESEIVERLADLDGGAAPRKIRVRTGEA